MSGSCGNGYKCNVEILSKKDEGELLTIVGYHTLVYFPETKFSVTESVQKVVENECHVSQKQASDTTAIR